MARSSVRLAQASPVYPAPLSHIACTVTERGRVSYPGIFLFGSSAQPRVSQSKRARSASVGQQ
jgi:hypothetical protein